MTVLKFLNNLLYSFFLNFIFLGDIIVNYNVSQCFSKNGTNSSEKNKPKHKTDGVDCNLPN